MNEGEKLIVIKHYGSYSIYKLLKLKKFKNFKTFIILNEIKWK